MNEISKITALRVDGPGIFPDITPAQYHDDPAPEPSLSASIAICLLTKTPFHAFIKHKRLSAQLRAEIGEPDGEDADDGNRASRFGSLAHELLLGRGQGIHVITETKDSKGNVVENPTHYKHAETQRIRDAAIAQGATPCLVHELERAEEVVDCVLSSLRRIPGCEDAFGEKRLGSEVTAIAREPGLDVWTRILVDSWGPGHGDLWDLKTTTDLSDEALMRKIANEQIDLRCAFYERCVARILPELAGRVGMNLVFVEAKPPFEVRVVQLPRTVLAMGHRKVAYALGLWERCLRSGEWPGYPKEIAMLGLPTFAEKNWLDREDPATGDPDVVSLVRNDPLVGAAANAPKEKPMLTEYRI